VNDNKGWLLGFILIVVFILLGEAIVIFYDYISLLGFSIDFALSILWLLPVIASFLAVFYSKNNGILKGFSLVVILSTLGPLTHLLCGYFGARIDMAGISGLRVTVPLDLVLGIPTVGLGVLVGFLVKKCGGNRVQ
jgi:hypothetical protein